MIIIIYFYVVIMISHASQFFTVQQCDSALHKARRVLQTTKIELAKEEYSRQRAYIAHIHAKLPSKKYSSKRFAVTGDEVPACPQPNTTIFPPQPTLPPPSIVKQMGKTSRKFVPSNGNSPPSIFNVNAEADPYLMWMKIFEDQISDDKVICNGPRFKGFHTVTDDQLWGILSILLANYATPFCPICEQMVRRFEGFVYTPNPFIHTEEEQHLHEILFAHLPRTQAFCSALMPACFENYATKVATTSNGTECMKCTMCTATLTFLQHQFLLSEVAVRKALEWLDSSFIHNICAEMCLSFPPNVPSDGGFFPHGVNYTECVAFSNSAFMFAVNAAKNIFKPEYFCSLEMGWCKPNETPDIMHCLRQLCEEQMPVELGRTLCRAIPDESIPLKDLLKAPIYGPKLFPTDESAQHNAQYKSEL